LDLAVVEIRSGADERTLEFLQGEPGATAARVSLCARIVGSEGGIERVVSNRQVGCSGAAVSRVKKESL